MTNLQNSTTTPLAYSECYVQPFFSFYNADNMAIMKTFGYKEFDLAIVDPPYDFSISKTNFVAKGKHNEKRFQRHGGQKIKEA